MTRRLSLAVVVGLGCAALVSAAQGPTLQDDLRAIRKELLKTSSSNDYFTKHAARRLADWKAAADKGSPEGLWLLGRCYQLGTGVKKDEDKAVRLFHKSADKDFALAQSSLGLLYNEGESVTRDEREAARMLQKGAEQGEAIAQYNLASMYYLGVGVDASPREAVRWLTKAGEQGHLGSLHALAAMYEYGKGVKADPAEAVKWYRKASDLADGKATAKLVLMYEEGLGVTRDLVEAKKLRAKARAELGPDSDEQILRIGILSNPVGRKAPNAEGTIDGKKFRLNDYRGKVVVLKFGAEWCAPCRAMVPQLKKMAARHDKQPFALLDVDVDLNRQLSEQWNIRSVPMVYVIDPEGIIRHHYDVRPGKELDEVVDTLLKASRKTP
ncbi:MAG: redoxin domain-containing protein [Gemmataceae bacterium]|nr:redoxin domain-containing protein [Gemmataceae bacterium]